MDGTSGERERKCGRYWSNSCAVYFEGEIEGARKVERQTDSTAATLRDGLTQTAGSC